MSTFDFSSYLSISPSPILALSPSPSLPNSTPSSLSSLPTLPSSSHSLSFLSLSSSSFPSSTDLTHLLRILQPSSSAIFHSSSSALLQQLKTDLILHGFVEVKVEEEKGIVIGKKAAWESGAAAPLAFMKKNKSAVAPAPAPTNGNKWTLTDTVEDDLIDEDDLLEREQDKVIKKVPSDCGTGSSTTKRKACKGCSCGLAEEEAAAEKAGMAAPVKKAGAGCGSCGLGDAFRCSTCPFLGQPVFSSTSGDKVKLQL